MKLLTIILFIAACNSPKKADTTPSGDTIVAKVNKTFTIELSTSMGTGYSWLPLDSAYKKYISVDSVGVVNNVTKEDGADNQVFYFTGIKKGTVEVIFIRKRPWEDASKRDKEKKFTIIIE